MEVLFAVWSGYPKERIYADPSVWYRCYQPAEALSGLGVRTVVTHFEDIDLDELNGYDIIVFFRPQFSPRFVDLFHGAERAGAICIASYDDLFFDIRLLRKSNFRGLGAPQEKILASRPYNYAQALYFFDRFIVSTLPMKEALARRGRDPNAEADIHVLFNAISPEALALARAAAVEGRVERVPRRIGYFAGGQSHSIDLDLIAPQLASVMEQDDATFFCVETVQVPEIIKKTGRVVTVPRLSYAGMILAYASCCVTIAPLVHDEFSASKSGIKYIEASAVGAAAVATPIPDIVRVADHRLLPAVEIGEWRDLLRRALELPVSPEITVRQQQRLAEGFSTDIEARKLRAYFERLLDGGDNAERPLTGRKIDAATPPAVLRGA